MCKTFVLHCGLYHDELVAGAQKCFLRLCLWFKLFGGGVIRGRLIFAYSQFRLQSFALHWNDAVGEFPSLHDRPFILTASLHVSTSPILAYRLVVVVLSKLEREFGREVLLGHFSSSWCYCTCVEIGSASDSNSPSEPLSVC